MFGFTGRLKLIGGEIHTWQELIFAAIDARVYSPDGPTNVIRRNQAKDQFRAASAYLRRFKPSGQLFLIDAYKGNVNGTLSQASWNLPDDVTDQAVAGTGAEYDGGVEYSQDYRTGLASQALYSDANIDIEVEIERSSIV